MAIGLPLPRISSICVLAAVISRESHAARLDDLDIGQTELAAPSADVGHMGSTACRRDCTTDSGIDSLRTMVSSLGSPSSKRKGWADWNDLEAEPHFPSYLPYRRARSIS